MASARSRMFNTALSSVQEVRHRSNRMDMDKIFFIVHICHTLSTLFTTESRDSPSLPLGTPRQRPLGDFGTGSIVFFEWLIRETFKKAVGCSWVQIYFKSVIYPNLFIKYLWTHSNIRKFIQSFSNSMSHHNCQSHLAFFLDKV